MDIVERYEEAKKTLLAGNDVEILYSEDPISRALAFFTAQMLKDMCQAREIEHETTYDKGRIQLKLSTSDS